MKKRILWGVYGVFFILYLYVVSQWISYFNGLLSKSFKGLYAIPINLLYVSIGLFLSIPDILSAVMELYGNGTEADTLSIRHRSVQVQWISLLLSLLVLIYYVFAPFVPRLVNDLLPAAAAEFLNGTFNFAPIIIVCCSYLFCRSICSTRPDPEEQQSGS
ncbi:hypothetical protein [Anaerolentibacter hominis]|uniref:hypothetical protein n=1 Tax=Anaerolentibacter hominis TaxID=3079009 RepID=UPI0031B894EE